MPINLITPDVVADIAAIPGGSFPLAAITDVRLQWRNGNNNPSLTYSAGSYKQNDDLTYQLSPVSIPETFPDVYAEMAVALPDQVAGVTPDAPVYVRAAWDTVMKWLLLRSLMLRARRA